MSVYCGFFNESVEREPEYTFESFTNFLFETELEMSALFERATIFTALNEDTTALAIPSTIDFSGAASTEEVKKTVLDTIKEILAKLGKAVTTAVQRLVEKVQQMYMNTNLTDKFVSQFKSLTTFENLKKCRDAGWPGVPVNVYSILSIPDITDSNLWKSYSRDEKDVDVTIYVEKDIDPIMTAKDLSEAREIYKKFRHKCANFKNKSEDIFSMEQNRQYAASTGYTGSKAPTKDPYIAISRDQSDRDHYYPTPEMFSKTKLLAEEGQKSTKKYKDDFKKSINNISQDKSVALTNLKSYSIGGVNRSSDKEINQISILYYKARYEYASAFVSRSKRIYQSVFQLLSVQHSMAIKQYFIWVAAIKRYIKPDKTAEA